VGLRESRRHRDRMTVLDAMRRVHERRAVRLARRRVRTHGELSSGGSRSRPARTEYRQLGQDDALLGRRRLARTRQTKQRTRLAGSIDLLPSHA
jgi:hypothetical protein